MLTKKECLQAVWYCIGVVAVLILFVWFVTSCDNTNVKPVIKPNMESEVEPELVDNISEVGGDVYTKKEVLTMIENEVDSRIQTFKTTNETPFWKIFLPIAIVVLISRYVDARASKKSTLKHLLGLKDKDK